MITYLGFLLEIKDFWVLPFCTEELFVEENGFDIGHRTSEF